MSVGADWSPCESVLDLIRALYPDQTVTRGRAEALLAQLVVLVSTVTPERALDAAWANQPQWQVWAAAPFLRYCDGGAVPVPAPVVLVDFTGRRLAANPTGSGLELLRAYAAVSPLPAPVERRMLTHKEVELLMVAYLRPDHLTVECAVCFDEFYPWERRHLAELESRSARAYTTASCRHPVCASCLGTIATQWHAHSIGPGSSSVRCPCEGCTEGFRTEDFAGLLDPADYGRLRRRAQQFPARIWIRCPFCATDLLFPRALARNVQEGALLVQCPACVDRGPFCYHCMDGRDVVWDAEGARMCAACVDGTRKDGQFNHFFRHPDKRFGDGRLSLPRNYELRPDDVVARLRRLVDTSAELELRCACCATRLHRTVGCNELSHCGMSICNMCGYSSNESDTLGLLDHFEGPGHTCPRYSDGAYWASQFPHPPTMAVCSSACCSATRDCANPDHRTYRARCDLVRRRIFVRSALASLPPSLTRRVRARLDALVADGDALARLVTRCRDGEWPVFAG